MGMRTNGDFQTHVFSDYVPGTVEKSSLLGTHLQIPPTAATLSVLEWKFDFG